LFGTWLEVYIQGCGLHYLGSKLTRPSTVQFVVHKLQAALESQQARDVLDNDKKWPVILRHAVDLLLQMLHSNPQSRISASQILHHPFLTLSENYFEGLNYEKASQIAFRNGILGERTGSSRDIKMIFREK
jgi:serine/threonine protein kinase